MRITLNGSWLTLKDVHSILFKNAPIYLDSKSLDKMEESYDFLKKFSQKGIIYGINTGFGPMAQYKVSKDNLNQLQYNLIRSHASGSGAALPNLYIKALMLARLNALLQGYSGVHTESVLLLKEFINQEIYPLIFEHGGVGASGDLVQLAHLALALIGEGKVSYQNKITPTHQVLNLRNLKPIQIHLREGIALINGTSVMTGVGLVNLLKAQNLLDWLIVASSMINEIVHAYDDHFSVALNKVKHHVGQSTVAEKMRHILAGSSRIRQREDHLYHKQVKEWVFKEKVQEYYSIRCVPQILGPVYDTLKTAEKVLINELNSVSDNPIVDVAQGNVFHGGNFHGDYVSLEMDKMKIAMTKLAMLAERQLNFLLNDKLNEILPPFINMGTLGFNFGMQGLQFTATSTVAENQTLSFPMYVHSIPNNNDNQDIVSMGTNAALMTKKVIDNAYEVTSILFIGILQAIDYLNIKGEIASYSKHIFSDLRNIVPKFVEDTPKYEAIAALKNHLLQYQPQAEQVALNKL